MDGPGVIKRFAIACGALACTLAYAASADAPDARRLAITDALLTYCSKADPSTTAKYQSELKRLEQGASPTVLAAVRRSTEYKERRDSMEQFMARIDEHNAKKMCSRPLGAQEKE